MTWNVGEALEEVATAIETGAQPFVIEPNTRERLKTLFEKDFTNQAAAGSQWSEDKKRVLTLARRIGARAKLLTLDELARSPGAVRRMGQSEDEAIAIDHEVALRTAYMVCKTYRTAGRKAGPYCPSLIAPAQVASAEAFDEILSDIRQSGHEV